MTLLETPSTMGSAAESSADDSIRLESSGGGEWLVVSDLATTEHGGCALAIIRQEPAGYTCYPNSLGYGRLGPYPTLDDAYEAAITRMA